MQKNQSRLLKWRKNKFMGFHKYPSAFVNGSEYFFYNKYNVGTHSGTQWSDIDWSSTSFKHVKKQKPTGISWISLIPLLTANGITISTKIDNIKKENTDNWNQSFFDFFECTYKEWEYFRDQNLIRLQKIQNFKGKQQSLGLPSRGQRTHTNAQTSRWLKYKISELNKLNKYFLLVFAADYSEHIDLLQYPIKFQSPDLAFLIALEDFHDNTMTWLIFLLVFIIHLLMTIWLKFWNKYKKKPEYDFYISEYSLNLKDIIFASPLFLFFLCAANLVHSIDNVKFIENIIKTNPYISPDVAKFISSNDKTKFTYHNYPDTYYVNPNRLIASYLTFDLPQCDRYIPAYFPIKALLNTPLGESLGLSENQTQLLHFNKNIFFSNDTYSFLYGFNHYNSLQLKHVISLKKYHNQAFNEFFKQQHQLLNDASKQLNNNLIDEKIVQKKSKIFNFDKIINFFKSLITVEATNDIPNKLSFKSKKDVLNNLCLKHNKKATNIDYDYLLKKKNKTIMKKYFEKRKKEGLNFWNPAFLESFRRRPMEPNIFIPQKKFSSDLIYRYFMSKPNFNDSLPKICNSSIEKKKILTVSDYISIQSKPTFFITPREFIIYDIGQNIRFSQNRNANLLFTSLNNFHNLILSGNSSHMSNLNEHLQIINNAIYIHKLIPNFSHAFIENLYPSIFYMKEMVLTTLTKQGCIFDTVAIIEKFKSQIIKEAMITNLKYMRNRFKHMYSFEFDDKNVSEFYENLVIESNNFTNTSSNLIWQVFYNDSKYYIRKLEKEYPRTPVPWDWQKQCSAELFKIDPTHNPDITYKNGKETQCFILDSVKNDIMLTEGFPSKLRKRYMDSLEDEFWKLDSLIKLLSKEK